MSFLSVPASRLTPAAADPGGGGGGGGGGSSWTVLKLQCAHQCQVVVLHHTDTDPGATEATEGSTPPPPTHPQEG